MSIYLDHNATTPCLPEVAEAICALYRKSQAWNASSVHQVGRVARQNVEHAREQVLSALNADPSRYRVIWTSGGTEANNHALNALEYDTCFVSATEHPSVLRAHSNSIEIGVDDHGIVDCEALNVLLSESKGTCLVSVMLANNETGVIQPIERIRDIVHAHNALLHCDAVQAFGKIPLDLNALDIDMLTLSGHKIGGIAGAGALVVRKKLDVQPYVKGGGQEQGARAGTENVPAIVAFGMAAEKTGKMVEHFATHIKPLRDHLESAIRHLPDIMIFGAEVDRLPNTCCVGIHGVSQETQLITLDLKEISVSAGSACTSGKVEPSHVLQAMGIPKEIASGAIRISLGYTTTREDIETCIITWQQMYKNLSKHQGKIGKLPNVA